MLEIKITRNNVQFTQSIFVLHLFCNFVLLSVERSPFDNCELLRLDYLQHKKLEFLGKKKEVYCIIWFFRLDFQLLLFEIIFTDVVIRFIIGIPRFVFNLLNIFFDFQIEVRIYLIIGNCLLSHTN